MTLANRETIQNSRSLVRAFGGLNETYACTEAEYSAGMNFSARNFPALSTRKPRRRLRELTGLNGMYHLNGLLTVCGKDLTYTPDAAGADPVVCTDAVVDGKKALVGIGTKILIFPDKVAFDTADGSVSALGAVWQAEGQSVQFAPCDASGKTYKVSSYGREEPEKPTDGQLFLRVEEEERPWASTSTLEEYSTSSGSWTTVPLEYCCITAAGVQELFAQWDTVTVAGTAAQQAGMWTKLDGDLVVYDVLENGLRVRVSPEGDYFYGTLVQGTDSVQWTSLDGRETPPTGSVTGALRRTAMPSRWAVTAPLPALPPAWAMRCFLRRTRCTSSTAPSLRIFSSPRCAAVALPKMRPAAYVC